MKQPGNGMNPGVIFVILIVVGLILLGFGVSDIVLGDAALEVSDSGPRDNTIFYLLIGAALAIYGFLSIVKMNQQNNSRRY